MMTRNLMIQTGLDQTPGQFLSTEICIIGGGAVGVTLALESAKAGFDVLVLEAGGPPGRDQATDDLDGEIVSAHRHAPLKECSARQLGGTTARWAGRCLPLDELDLERRAHVAESGWPLAWEELQRWYPQASEYCHVAPGRFTVPEALPAAPVAMVPGFRDGAIIGSRLERWSLPTHFGRHYRAALTGDRRIRVLLRSTCTKLKLDAQSRQIVEAVVAAAPGREFRVRAKVFVIAGGGIESTRLLLSSCDSGGGAIGDRYGHLGRWYMGHLSGSVAEIQFHGDPRQTLYGLEPDRHGVFCRRRFWPAPDTQRREGLLNTAFWPTNPAASDPGHRNGLLSAAYLALSTPLLRDILATPVIRRMFCGTPDRPRYRAHMVNVLRDFPRASSDAAYFLYRRFLTQRSVPALFVGSPTNRYELYFHAEQAPNWSSRVSLCDRVDRLGRRRPRVDLRYSDQDIDSVVRSHQVLAHELGDIQGVATVVYKGSDVHAQVSALAADGYHQLGTTRMSESERTGVVDPDTRVHGVKNLYVCSSSVFPTGGHANPTLTVVALAVRLADHLRHLAAGDALERSA